MKFAFKITLLLVLFFDYVKSSPSFHDKFKKVSTPDDCESNPESEKIFGHRTNFYADESENVFCFRKKDGVIRMSSTSRQFEDPRFMCSKGPMAWYRGRKNVDFQGRPCLFWSSISNSTFDISNSSSSSYSMKRILPDEYENFCRNPDEDPLGPWCHVVGALRAPCFEPCRPSTETSSEFVCLNRDGFPYTELDLSDVVDLPQLIAHFDNVHLMYESRFVLPIQVDRLSTKSCIVSGPIAKQFGPWIAVLNDVAKDFLKTVGRKSLRDLCVPQDPIEPPSYKEGILIDALIEDELTVSSCSFWRRCFSSCQDDMTNCWDTKRKSYFGTKTTTVSGRNCMPWTQVSSEILKMAEKSNSTEQYHLYSTLLFEDPSQFFVKSRLFLNTESSCMLLNRRNSTDIEESYPPNSNFSKEKFLSEFQKMFQQGPGCFVKHNKTIEFDSCYSDCESSEPKIVLTKKLCLEKKRYAICKPKKADDWLKRGRRV